MGLRALGVLFSFCSCFAVPKFIRKYSKIFIYSGAFIQPLIQIPFAHSRIRGPPPQPSSHSCPTSEPSNQARSCSKDNPAYTKSYSLRLISFMFFRLSIGLVCSVLERTEEDPWEGSRVDQVRRHEAEGVRRGERVL